MKNLKNVALTLLIFAGTIGAWEAVVRIFAIPVFILPPPSQVVIALGRGFGSGLYQEHLEYTLLETVLGFIVGSSLGFFLGTAVAMSRWVEFFLYPYIVMFQSLPKVALAPIFITWFGFGLSSKIVMAATISFFPTLVNTIVGLGAVSEDARMLFRSLVAKRRDTFLKLQLPAALPYVFAGLKTSLTFAFIGAIVGEFVGANFGIGLLVETYNFQLDVPMVFALIVVLSVVGLALYLGFEYVDRKVVFWREPREGLGE